MLNSASADSNEALASLLATATLALDTDRRAAKSCIQRAAALLGIDLSREGTELQSTRLCRAVSPRGRPSASSPTSKTNLTRVSESPTSLASRSSARAISSAPFARPLESHLSPTSCSGASGEPRN